MKIAIPSSGGVLGQHFGDCSTFEMFEVAPERRAVVTRATLHPPRHAPGVLPHWLESEGVDVVIAGGMGARAKALLGEAGIQVIGGCPSAAPEALVQSYLDGTLEPGEVNCGHACRH